MDDENLCGTDAGGNLGRGAQVFADRLFGSGGRHELLRLVQLEIFDLVGVTQAGEARSEDGDRYE
jgi:hypothetical protein